MTGVESFLQHLKQVKRYSSNTLCAYKNDLIQFFQYLSDNYQVQNTSDIHAKMIRSWLAELHSENSSLRTINRKRSSLQSYFRFLISQGILEGNPMDKISPIKRERSLPVFVEEDNINKLLDGFIPDDNFETCRDHLVLLLLYTTGMRLSELIGIKLSDIDLNNKTVKVLGKGNKERIVPVLDEVKVLVIKYLELREGKFGYVSSDNLLLTNKGGVLYRKFVYSLVNSYLSTATTIKKKSPHVLRHSFATHMLNNGADLNAIKEILGHSNLSATQIYTHNSFKKIRNVYKQAHPKA